jgi:predicted RNA-binding Zn ribbon-like protein
MPPARQAAVRNSEKRSLFVFAGDTPANTHPGHDEGVLARVRAVTATELAYVLCDYGGHRLGRCLDERCHRVFVDVSKGGRRQFCSTRCANRVNAVRHRARVGVGKRQTSVSS